MILHVYGNPYIEQPHVSKTGTVIASYDPAADMTVIDSSIDIVTLGIAVNVLQQQYEDYLRSLPVELAAQIRNTTRKAVEQHG